MSESTAQRRGVEEDDRLAAEALRGNYITEAQLKEARAIQEKFSALGLARRSLGEIFLQRGSLSRISLRELYRRISPDVDLPQIGGYQVIAKVGEGGMGAVYEARQVSLDRKVALKLLHPALAEDELYLKRFVREARAVALLNHPNIVSGIDVGQEGRLHYFVMEFVEGQTVKEMLREEGFLPEKLSFEIARQVGLALEQASRHSLVHRDIKPENIILTEQYVAKLCDLGLARPEGGGDSLTESGATHGTPFYMSPEQACGEALDARSDIYALGVTLYEMVTGERPFTGRTAAEVLIRQIGDDPVSPRKRNGLLSVGAERVILKMMAKRPAERYQDPRQLVSDLEDVIGSRMPKGVKEAGLLATHKVSHESRADSTGRGRLLALGLLVLLLSLYSAFVSWKAFRKEAPRPDKIVVQADGTTAAKDRDPDWTARRLFEYAVRYDQAHRKAAIDEQNPDRVALVGRIKERYQQVAGQFPNSYWAFQAQDQLEQLSAREGDLRRRSLDQLRTAVREQCARNQFALAFERIGQFQWSPQWVAERIKLKEEVQLAASRELDAVLLKAREALNAGRHVVAISQIERFLGTNPPIDRARADRLLFEIRLAMAKVNVARRETQAARQDRLLYEAFTAQRKSLRRYQLEDVQRSLREQRKRASNPWLRRRLHSLEDFLLEGKQVTRAAEEALADSAKRGISTRLFDRAGKSVVGRLISVTAKMVVLRVGGGQRTVELADQPPSVVLWWAERAAAKPDPKGHAAFLAAAGQLMEAQRMLEAQDDLVVDLLAILRRHSANELLRKYRQLEADDKPDETLAVLQVLIGQYADTAPVLDNGAVLLARRKDLLDKQAKAQVRPVGRILEQNRNRFKLAYFFGKQRETEDWELGQGVQWVKGYLRNPGKSAGIRYRYRISPPFQLRVTVVFSEGQQPGLVLYWEQAGGALRLHVPKNGLLTLHWKSLSSNQSILVAEKQLSNELLNGIYNIQLSLRKSELLLQLDGRLKFRTPLKRAATIGRLSIVAPAGALEIRKIILDGALQSQ